MGIKPCREIENDAVPLFVPIILQKRDKVRKAMFAEHIFCPVHWPVIEYKEELKTGVYMAEHELSLIVDHRYSSDDMDRILTVIKNNI